MKVYNHHDISISPIFCLCFEPLFTSHDLALSQMEFPAVPVTWRPIFLGIFYVINRAMETSDRYRLLANKKSVFKKGDASGVSCL